MSQAVRETLAVLLEPICLQKGDGEYEIGKEVLKYDIRLSLEALTGVKL
jgi:hypothetical protein